MYLSDVVSYVLPSSIAELSQIVFSETPKMEISAENHGSEETQLIAAIGFSGSFSASLALATGNVAACALVSRMLGGNIQRVSQDVVDGVAELVNMLAGVTKTKFSEKSYSLTLSLPTIITGNNAVSVRQPMKSEKMVYSVNMKDFSFAVHFFYSLSDENQTSLAQSMAESARISLGHRAAQALQDLLSGKKQT